MFNLNFARDLKKKALKYESWLRPSNKSPKDEKEPRWTGDEKE